MKNTWARTWNASAQPRKQRKFAYHAPEHRRRKLISIHLSPELRKKHGTRSLPLRVGDTVKVLRGEEKGRIGKVERVDIGSFRIQVSGLEVSKKDGSKSPVLLSPSNVVATDLVTSDKRRFKTIAGRQGQPARKQTPQQAPMKG